MSLLLGLASHFASRPGPERTRIFVATSGHHNGPSSGQKRIVAAHPDLIAPCVLIVHLDHVGSCEPDGRGRLQKWAGPKVMFVATRTLTCCVWSRRASRPTACRSCVRARHSGPLRPSGDPSGHDPAVLVLVSHRGRHTGQMDPYGLNAMARVHADVISGADAVSRVDLRIGTPSMRYGT